MSYFDKGLAAINAHIEQCAKGIYSSDAFNRDKFMKKQSVLLFNVRKYLCRYTEKRDIEKARNPKDLLKAIHYMAMIIDVKYVNQPIVIKMDDYNKIMVDNYNKHADEVTPEDLFAKIDEATDESRIEFGASQFCTISLICYYGKHHC